ncbi:hypothetical protein ACWF94_14900 [Streptomyces sp. NPDC055078]
MSVPPWDGHGHDLATAADSLVAGVIDRLDNRWLADPPRRSTTAELNAAWNRVRTRPGTLSAKSSAAWGHIENFTEGCGILWFLISTATGVLFLVLPVDGWTGTVVHGLILLSVSLTMGLAATRFAVHYTVRAAISNEYAARSRIRTVAFLLGTRAVLLGAAVTASVLYPTFGVPHD